MMAGTLVLEKLFVGAVDATSGSSRHTALMRLVKLSL